MFVRPEVTLCGSQEVKNRLPTNSVPNQIKRWLTIVRENNALLFHHRQPVPSKTETAPLLHSRSLHPFAHETLTGPPYPSIQSKLSQTGKWKSFTNRGSPCQDPAGTRTIRRPDHSKETHCSGMVVSPVHQFWPKPSCKANWTGEEDKVDRGRSGKTVSGNGQAWSSPSPRGQWRTGKNGGNWLRNHLWCPATLTVKG